MIWGLAPKIEVKMKYVYVEAPEGEEWGVPTEWRPIPMGTSLYLGGAATKKDQRAIDRITMFKEKYPGDFSVTILLSEKSLKEASFGREGKKNLLHVFRLVYIKFCFYLTLLMLLHGLVQQKIMRRI